MAAVTKPQREKDVVADESEREEERQLAKLSKESVSPSGRVTGKGNGYFSIYKSGQGYWTRMGSLGGAALIIALTVYNLYVFLSVNFEVPRNIALGVTAGAAMALVLLTFWLLNKPDNVDFLIATDSEMKKVNWTTQNELVGSTKIVILFVIAIAGFLFLIDVIFGYFFQLITVLKTGPFG